MDRDPVQSLDLLWAADGRIGVTEAAVAHGVHAPGVDRAVLGESQAVNVAQRNVHDPLGGEILHDPGQEHRVVRLRGAQAQTGPSAPSVDLKEKNTIIIIPIEIKQFTQL